MSFLDRAGLDAKSWLASLRGSARIMIPCLAGFLLSWLVLRVVAFDADKAGALAIYGTGTEPMVAGTAWVIASTGSLLWMPLAFWLYVFRKDRHEWTSAVLVAIGTILSMVFVDLLKTAFMLPRPPDVLEGVIYRVFYGSGPTNAAFPSGHTSRAFTLATVMWSRYSKWKIPFAVLAMATGISMIIIGYHFPSDVMGGAFTGIAIGTFMVNLAKARAH